MGVATSATTCCGKDDSSASEIRDRSAKTDMMTMETVSEGAGVESVIAVMRDKEKQEIALREQQAKKEQAPGEAMKKVLPGSYFELVLVRDSFSDTYGFDLVDLADRGGPTGIVLDVREDSVTGLFNRKNLDCEGILRPGDQVAAVNDCPSSRIVEMIDALKASKRSTLKVYRPKELDIDIVKISERLSIDVVTHHGLCIITKIEPGDVATHNKQHPESAVQVADVLFEVNGHRGEGEELIRQLRVPCGVVRLRVKRYVH
mmetsp:Transcript_12705/g.29086  ORF Transcript_12705/g.29086 Transcript_12705/m.29086 type:complete len:260 (+) Transcript_12705:63-842(+)